VRAARLWRLAAPLAVGALVLALWEIAVRAEGIPRYILPGPLLIAETLWTDGPSLLGALLVTLRVTLAALAAAAILGGGLAIIFSLSRVLALSLFPYAVILQVTPIVAIAPLIIIWVREPFLALLVCAWIVAFFPVVANTTVGLNSADRNLLALFRLYGASRTQTLRYLKLPTALPYFLAGLRISGGLALIGAVVAEFVAGTGGAETGLALPDPGGGLPPRDPPAVRRTVPAVCDRHPHLRPVRCAVAPAAASLARKRDRRRGGVIECGLRAHAASAAAATTEPDSDNL
jgi:NitT/TauT family transport system permease protein